MKRILFAFLLSIAVTVSLSGCGKEARAIDGDIELSWDENPAAQEVTEYSVYRSTDGASPVFFMTVLPSAAINGRVAVIFHEYPGRHCYQVQAHNVWGASAFSAVTEDACVQDAPSTPTNVRVSAG